jgi:hypothetical protein
VAVRGSAGDGKGRLACGPLGVGNSCKGVLCPSFSATDKVESGRGAAASLADLVQWDRSEVSHDHGSKYPNIWDSHPTIVQDS